MNADLLEVISLANTLSSHVGLDLRVSSLRQCNALFFSQLLSALTGAKLTPLSTEAARCQAVVDALSNHLSPNISLDHIKGADLARQDPLSIKNLLDIFSVLFCLPPPLCYHDNEREANDSNMLSTEGFSVISEVLREELGSLTPSHPPHSTTDIDSTTELLRPVPRAAVPSVAIATSAPATPPQSPDRRRSLQSPLHHSTPHVGTRSRVYTTTEPHTPHVLTYTPHQPNDSSSSVLPDSTLSTAMEGSHTPVQQTVTSSPPQQSPLSRQRGSVNIKQPQNVRQSSTVDRSSVNQPSSPLPSVSEPVRPSDHSASQSDDGGGDLDRSREDVLAMLYRNYVSTLRKGRTGTKGKRSKVTTRKRAKTKTVRVESPSSDSSEDEQVEEVPKEVAIGDDLLPVVGRDFPFLHMTPSMMGVLWQKQMAQVTALSKSGQRERGAGLAVKVRDMEKRHQALLNVIRKELEHSKRMQHTSKQRSQKQAVLTSVHSKRQSAARAKRYFHDYELRLRAKLQRERTREEQIFKRAFENGLALQRERVRELRRLAKEKEDASAREHKDRLEAMENFYRDQFTMLTESMLTEKHNTAVREKAQNKLVRGVRREFRQRMEREVKDLQDCLDRDQDIEHFRDLDELQLRHKLANLTFTSNTRTH